MYIPGVAAAVMVVVGVDVVPTVVEGVIIMLLLPSVEKVATLVSSTTRYNDIVPIMTRTAKCFD